MPKLKAVLLLILSVGLILSLSGCGLLFSQSADLEEVESDPEIELPEWLLLAHRSTSDLRAEEDQEPAMPKSDEEDDEDEDIEETAEPEPEAAAPAPQEQPAPAAQPAQSSSPAEEEKEESSGPSKSQQMLAESWKQKQDQDGQSDNDIDKGEEDESWWNPSKQNFTHDKPEW